MKKCPSLLHKQGFRCGPGTAFEVGRELCKGLSDKEIARNLGLSLMIVKHAIAALASEQRVKRGHLQRVVLAVKLSGYPIFAEGG